MHLERSKAFVDRLAHNGLQHESILFKSYIEALEQSIPDELDFRSEVKKYVEMTEFFKKMNASMKGELKGWEFSVPKVDPRWIAEDFFLSDFAGGDSYHELADGPEKKSTGRMIFKSMVGGLLSFGMFEPDRHVHNIKVDVSKRIIHMLDPGQFQKFNTSAMPLREDDRSIIAKFLLGISLGEVDILLSALDYMKGPGSKISGQSLRPVVERIFSQYDNSSQRTIELIKELHRNNFVMDFRFSFTALKGLMVLNNEKYVSEQEGKEILKNSVTKALLKKLDFKTLKQARRSNSSSSEMCRAFYAQ
jgi:predicted unusual protein kinase regulating ubiquinone biosynthesis (AarF/ABC1/UbiB family)